MKKPLKIIAIAAVVLVIAGLLTGEILFAMHLKNKDEALETKTAMLQERLDKAEEEIERLERANKEAFSEESLVESLKKALEDYIYIDEEEFGDIGTLEEFINAIISSKWQEEIHDIWDGTAVVEAYRSGNADGLSEEDAYVLETASGIIDEIIKDGMTDYEKELAVYNWQVDYVSYDEEHFSPIPVEDVDKYNYYPYGVLKYHSAICVGNATTFKLFMDMLDIDCKIIHSTEDGEHAWNLVCLDDEWYHVDVTFDGGYKEPDYAYFNVPDSFKVDGGYPWNRDEFPAAEGYKYCYCYNNAVEVNNLDDIKQLTNDAVNNGGGSIYIKSKEYIEGVENVIEEISQNSDYMWILLDQNGAAVGEDFFYKITIEQNIDDVLDSSR